MRDEKRVGQVNLQYRGSCLGYSNSDYDAWHSRDGTWDFRAPRIFVIDDLMSNKEIEEFLQLVGHDAFAEPRNKYGEVIDDADIRTDSSVTIKMHDIAELLWKRIRPYFPGVQFRVAGHRGFLNPNLRVSKYDIGAYFRPHYDSPYLDPTDPHTASQYTLLLYLNDVESGGETRFINGEKWLKMDVPPRAGRAVVFDYNVLHCGQPVTAGDPKIVLKADVMVENRRAKMAPGCRD